MNKKIKSILTLFLLAFFIVTSFNVTTANGSAYYSLSMAGSLTKVQSFSPYKVIITATVLNIRKSPSNFGAIVGSYKKDTVVDVTGQFGSYLKTSKGYISSQYTKKYSSSGTGTTPSPGGTTGFQTYKVTITTAKLNIRKGPSTDTAIVGTYSGGTIVDVIGESAGFLQTSLGYIAKEYTLKYTPPSRGDSAPVEYAQFIRVNDDTPLLLDVNGAPDERYAVKGKTYGVIASVSDHYKIKIGKVYGYIPASKATVLTTPYKNKITLAWQYVYSKASNSTYYNESSDYIRRSSADLGLDVISPTWFYMTGDTSANINAAEKADREYVRTAHRNGYEVWALYQEFNKDRAYKTFYDSTVKNRVINQIVSYAVQYEVDGVNIDYEGIGGIPANKDGFTAFVRDLSARLKAVGVTVSVDVVKPTVGSVYSNFTDRPALASYTDYLVYMAYDEHYAGAQKAGSVGSFPWVEKGLQDTIAQGVPKEKIILGVPFYLRDFTVQNTYQPYDAVIFSQDGRLYASPFDYANKLMDVSKGYTYKYLEKVSDWYKVELESETAYIPANNSILALANTDLKAVDASLNIAFPYDTVTAKAQGIVYASPSDTSGIVGILNPGYAYKSAQAVSGWHKISYNGADAYVMEGNVAYLPKFSSINTLENTGSIMVSNDMVVIKNETGLYKSPTTSESERAGDIKVGESFKYLGMAPGTTDWYIVDYNGKQAYAHKSYTSFIAANTTTSSAVVTSSAVSLQDRKSVV